MLKMRRKEAKKMKQAKKTKKEQQPKAMVYDQYREKKLN